MKRYSDVRAYVREVLLALCFLSALPAIVNRSADLVGPVPHAGYLFLLIILWGGLLGAAYTPPAILRWITAFLLAGAAYYMLVFERVTTEFLTYDAFINMLHSAAFIGATPWLAMFALTGLLFLRGGDGARGQPPSFAPIAYLTLAGYEKATGNIGEPVRSTSVGPPAAQPEYHPHRR